MSTSLLYHGFGIRGYEHVRTYYEEGGIIFKIRQQRNELRCPCCGSRDVTCRGQVERPFKSLPIGLKPVSILLAIQRVWCAACDVVRQVRIGFADQRRTYTRSFERYALELLRHMTIQDVAQHLGVSWDVIKDIEKRNLKKRFSRPKLRKLKRIAIDEISIGRGHHYLTIVLDLITGAVVFVGDGKGSDALAPLWTKLKRSRAKIKAVAIDMSPAYISAVMENLKEATIVFDHFHVIKLFNEKLSDLRRTLYHQALTQEEKHVIKGTRWLLLKNPENLDETRSEHERLQEALALNQPLATAYYLKEDLRQLWSYPNKRAAKAFLKDWVARARASGINMLVKFANTLIAHASGILAYYNFHISTGPLEGTNNKIKVMKRQAYGFRDMEFFKLKIMAIHHSKYALVG
jgi:transposase